MSKTISYKEWFYKYKKWRDDERDYHIHENMDNMSDDLWCSYLYLQYLIEEEDWDSLKNMAKELQSRDDAGIYKRFIND